MATIDYHHGVRVIEITEGIRPTRIVKVRPNSWPDVHLPREEYLSDGVSGIDERFPTPAIFMKY